jgi:hypothetical protein
VVDLVLVAAPLRDLDDRGVLAHAGSPRGWKLVLELGPRPGRNGARSAE